MILVGDAMSVPVLTVEPDTGLREAARMLLERGVSALPVVDAGGTVVGVVSEADVVLHTPGPRAPTVADVMTSPAITVREDTPLDEAARLMHRYAVKRLPVVDHRGRARGIVTRMDLLTALLQDADPMPPDVRRMLRARRREMAHP